MTIFGPESFLFFSFFLEELIFFFTSSGPASIPSSLVGLLQASG